MTKGLHFAAHIALEFGLGVALAVVPFALDFADGAMIASIVLGAVIATVAISTSIGSHRVGAHASWDRAAAFLLVVAAIATAIDDIGAEAAVFGAAAVLELLLIANTRYTPERDVPERIR